jgi:hypothetical protein
MNNLRFLSTLAIATFTTIAAGQIEDGMIFDDPMVVSTTPGQDAMKGKLLRLIYPTDEGFQKPLVVIYADAVGPDVWDFTGAMHKARDIFVTRSLDNGQTWSQPLNLAQTALAASIMADHDGDPETPPIAYYGDSAKPNVFSSGKVIVVTWVDAFCPTPGQRTVIYPEFGQVEVPYKAVYAVRSTDGGATWGEAQRLTDGFRDAKSDVNRGNSNGWVIVWQEDPQGLQPGQAEGPGEGGSGAKVTKGTDVWYTTLAGPSLMAGDPFPPGQRLTDNYTMDGQGQDEGYESGTAGASRPNLALMGSTAIVAYEETKGTEGLDFGKYVRYHVFSAFDDSMPDQSMGAGWIVSRPTENARRVRFVAQGTPGPESGVKLFMFFKQGAYDEGGPSDIMGRVAFNGFLPEHLYPAVGANPETREGAMDNVPCLNFSSVLGLECGSDDNPFEDARAHRAVLIGDFLALGFSYTPDWAVARYTDLENYNFYMRRSFDGGMTWDEPRDLSGITDTRVNVLEPRLLKTPSSPDPADVQNKNVLVVAWGTEVNQYEHVGEPAIPLNIAFTRTTDRGETYEPTQFLAGRPVPDMESQLRSSPDGKDVFAVWQQRVDGATNVLFRHGTEGQLVVGDINGDGVVSVLDLIILMQNWGTVGPGDLNGNGIVDVQDLTLLIMHWD